ncbi:hypothetical protein BGW80DRAFT_1308229 [Lactifluus volemus]|nr:hypothetical protein BGW80DRAFT_1308229 [Lactifluus volemus]
MPRKYAARIAQAFTATDRSEDMDRQLEGVKMRLRKSQPKFPVHNVEEAECEIARLYAPAQVCVNK